MIGYGIIYQVLLEFILGLVGKLILELGLVILQVKFKLSSTGELDN